MNSKVSKQAKEKKRHRGKSMTTIELIIDNIYNNIYNVNKTHQNFDDDDDDDRMKRCIYQSNGN